MSQPVREKYPPVTIVTLAITIVICTVLLIGFFLSVSQVLGTEEDEVARHIAVGWYGYFMAIIFCEAVICTGILVQIVRGNKA